MGCRCCGWVGGWVGGERKVYWSSCELQTIPTYRHRPHRHVFQMVCSAQQHLQISPNLAGPTSSAASGSALPSQLAPQLSFPDGPPYGQGEEKFSSRPSSPPDGDIGASQAHVGHFSRRGPRRALLISPAKRRGEFRALIMGGTPRYIGPSMALRWWSTWPSRLRTTAMLSSRSLMLTGIVV